MCRQRVGRHGCADAEGWGTEHGHGAGHGSWGEKQEAVRGVETKERRERKERRWGRRMGWGEGGGGDAETQWHKDETRADEHSVRVRLRLWHGSAVADSEDDYRL